MKKIQKDFWEKLFTYPSFNIRFGFTVLLIILVFCVVVYSVFSKLPFIREISDQIATLNLIIQFAILVLGIFAAYYALRQLVETRFINLDEAAMAELKRKHYSKAFAKWREAFYIRPEAAVFTNLCESLLLIGDYDTFDSYIRISQRTGFLKKEIFQEISDQIILLYLKSLRHLLVKNQGEAERYISELIDLAKQDGLLGLDWDFLDMQTSILYQDLSGECKIIADNLISYLSNTMTPNRKADFESKKCATQIT